MITVSARKYDGVDVDHPDVIRGIKVLARQGKQTQEIMKLVGMPYEVVRKYMREVEQERSR